MDELGLDWELGLDILVVVEDEGFLQLSLLRGDAAGGLVARS